MFSRNFIIALRMSDLPQYVLAQQVGLNPSLLSRWVIGLQKPPHNDPRLMKLAEILGLKSDEAFSKNPSENEKEHL